MSQTEWERNQCPAGTSFLWEDAPDEEKYSVCVHCGMCLDACPTYQETGLEHQSPRGRVYFIKSAAEGKISLDEAFQDPIFQCLDCRACETACPSGVQVGSLIEQARGQIYRADPPSGIKGWINRLFLRAIFPHPQRLHFLGKLTRFYQRSGLQKFMQKSKLLHLILPAHLRYMEKTLPQVKEPVLQSFPEVIPAHGEKRVRVALLTGCVMDVLFSEVNQATIRVLTRNGCEVVLPQNQKCCGALQVHAGDRETAKQLARQNIDAFLAAGVDSIIVNAAGCGAALKEYDELLHNDPEYRERAVEFSKKVEDISKFLYDLGIRPPRGEIRAKVTYHDACHLAHAQRIRQQPRHLLQQIRGIEMVTLPDADRCCGSAGIYNLTHPQMADRLLSRKLNDISPDAEIIAMGNPGCMMQIAMGIEKEGRPQKVMHTVELLDLAYQKETGDEMISSVNEAAASAKEGE